MTSTIKVNKIEKESGSTLTLGGPSTAVTLACGATQTGFGRTGTVDWCTTAKTGPLTAVSGKGYFINTTAGTITVTLPSSPSAGDIVSLKDYAKTWDTYGVTLGRGGSKIAGQCLCASLSTEAQSITLIYVDGTQGWIDIQDSTSSVAGSPAYVAATGGNTVLTVGDYKTHIFTADGNFVVSSAGLPAGSNSVDYFVVGGGASGGAPHFNGSGAGGGGAGGFRISNAYSIPAPTMSPLISPTGLGVSIQTYPITVGGGGAGVTSPSSTYQPGNNGSLSTFSSITSAGGGAGSGGNSPVNPAGNGGSGGGGGYNANPAPTGLGNTPPVSPPQGQNGGSNDPSTGGSYAAAAGGGAGAVGGSSPADNTGGTGGAGSYVGYPFFGPTAPSYGTPGPVSSTRYFSGGGGGGGGITSPYPAGSVNGGAGGSGGGGNGGGQPAPSRTGTAGTVNTGGGSGGGSSNYNPPAVGSTLAGGSGFVAIRYKFQN